MDDQLKDGKADQERPIDPLQRIFVPIERRNVDGQWTFQTIDKTKYVRGADGSIRRVAPKINGKQAKRHRQKMRRTTAWGGSHGENNARDI